MTHTGHAMDSATLDEGAALLAAATPGPWTIHRTAKTLVIGTAPTDHLVAGCGGYANNSRDPVELSNTQEANAAAIAWLRTHAADLLAAARQAQDNAKDAGWQPIATAPTDDWVRCDLWLKIYPSPRSFGMADSFRVVEAYRIDGKWVHRHEGKIQELYAPYITHWILTPSEPDAIVAATPGKESK